MDIYALHSNCVITSTGIKEATLVIAGGVITDLVPGFPANLPVAVTDLQNKVIMPGVIDPHVHINEPGRTEWEGFDTATRAAIAGGITTLVDMPLNASPVTTTVTAFDKKIAATHGKLHANCGFWGGLVPGNNSHIEPLIEKGVLGFKAFLTHSGIDEFPNVIEEDLHKAMPLIAKHGLPLLVHCELEQPLAGPQLSTNQTSYQAYLASRPKEWEDAAIALVIRLCEQYHCRTHIVHLSSANSIEQIARAKQKGLPLTVETAQHYLYFNAEEIPDAQTQFKCAPPIRERVNNELLWQALKEGIIDFVATDHSPAPPGIKELQSGDLTKAWGGISSIQLALPVLWTAARKHQASLTQLSEWLCSKPSLLAGQATRGRIAKGMTADLVVWDAEQTFRVTPGNIHHKHKITPYLNEILYGVVEQTYIKGTMVFDKGIFTALNNGELINVHR